MKTKWPPLWIYYTSIGYISAEMRSSALLEAYLYGLLTTAMVVGPLMEVKDLSKVRNRQVAKL